MANTNFSTVKHMHKVDRQNVRQVRPSEWKANGLQVRDEKWHHYWITHQDLANWYEGGEQRLRRLSKSPEDAERRLWEVFDEQYGHIANFFQQVYEPKPERMREYCAGLKRWRKRK